MEETRTQFGWTGRRRINNLQPSGGLLAHGSYIMPYFLFSGHIMFVLVKFKVRSTSSFNCDQICVELTAPVSEGSTASKLPR